MEGPREDSKKARACGALQVGQQLLQRCLDLLRQLRPRAPRLALRHLLGTGELCEQPGAALRRRELLLSNIHEQIGCQHHYINKSVERDVVV